MDTITGSPKTSGFLECAEELVRGESDRKFCCEFFGEDISEEMDYGRV